MYSSTALVLFLSLSLSNSFIIYLSVYVSVRPCLYSEGTTHVVVHALPRARADDDGKGRFYMFKVCSLKFYTHLARYHSKDPKN
jgi:hypothetical protein